VGEFVKMISLFDPVNQGLIIIAVVGFMLLILSVLTGAAPDLIADRENDRLPLLRIPLIGLLLSLIGVGEVPIVFLLGIYPFMIGTLGLGVNLLWYWHFQTYPLHSDWLIVYLPGILTARIFIFIAGKIRRVLKTYTVAKQMIPERFIGKTGKVIAALGNDLMEVNVYDELGKCQVQLYCLSCEKIAEQNLKIGDQVYIVDLIAPRRYSIIKFDS
jgi:hypothetical protein